MQGELAGPRVRRLLDDARGRCEVRVLPNYRQLIEGSVTVQPRPVSIEDLLQREPVRLDIEDIRQWIDGRVILVTGSAGSIGSEICRQLLAFDPQRIVAVDRAETSQFFLERELQSLALAGGAQTGVVPFSAGRKIDVCLADVLDGPGMRRILMRHRPHVIFHAAAYKHVPLMDAPSPGGGEEHRGRHPPAGRPGRRPAHRFLRADLDRQGGQSHQRDGGLQAGRRTVRPIVGRPGPGPVGDRAVRQRAGLGGERCATVPPADSRGRTRDGHPPRRPPLLYDHSGSLRGW